MLGGTGKNLIVRHPNTVDSPSCGATNSGDTMYQRSGPQSINSGRRKCKPSGLALKNDIERRRAIHLIAMQRFLAIFICTALGVSRLAALALFYFQGFRAWGFRLDPREIHWIGFATVGALAGLAATVFSSLFRRK